MAKHQVFLVHGMGDFQHDWSLGIQKLMRDAYAQYAVTGTIGWDADFQFVELNYSDIFEEIRQQWRENAEAASQALIASGLASAGARQLVNLANGATGDDFFRTHVLDVVLYRFFKPVAERVQQAVRKQILERLNAFPQNDTPPWSILAHSLGTSVTNDTLHAMFTQVVDGQLLGDRFKPDFVFMVANVSRVLWSKGGNFFASAVRPHSLETRGMCFKYCSYNHPLDPFPRVQRFNPPPADWFPPGGDPKSLYEFFEMKQDDIQDINVHGLSHYLSHPSVHASIFRTLWSSPQLIGDAEIAAAYKSWRKNTLTAAKRTQAIKLLKDYAVTGSADWTQIVDSIMRFRTDVLERGGSTQDGEIVHA